MSDKQKNINIVYKIEQLDAVNKRTKTEVKIAFQLQFEMNNHHMATFSVLFMCCCFFSVPSIMVAVKIYKRKNTRNFFNQVVGVMLLLTGIHNFLSPIMLGPPDQLYGVRGPLQIVWETNPPSLTLFRLALFIRTNRLGGGLISPPLTKFLEPPLNQNFLVFFLLA